MIRSEAAIRSNQPILALSAKWQTYPERFHWAIENGFAVEYSPNPAALDSLPEHVNSILMAGLPVRYHALFPGYEIGHRDADIREKAMRVHMATLEAMHEHGQHVITMHVAFNPNDEIDSAVVIENLSKLVNRAAELGITICLENLRRGLTSYPENVAEWARESGAMITFDVGHAISSQRVQDGELTAIEFLEVIADRLYEVHFYERETDRHHPPKDLSVLGPVVDHLLETECQWWTLELDYYDEALATRQMLLDYLSTIQ